MATIDLHLARLDEAERATARHHLVLGIAAALKRVNSVEGATPGELAEASAAEAAWRAADKALTDYQASKL